MFIMFLLANCNKQVSYMMTKKAKTEDNYSMSIYTITKIKGIMLVKVGIIKYKHIII